MTTALFVRNAWHRHRAALSVVDETLDIDHLARELVVAFNADEAAIADFLMAHGLCGLWCARLLARSDLATQHASLSERIRPAYLAAVVHQRAQENVMRALSAAFDDSDIPFVFLKTAGLRGELYPALGLRPSTDIDLLIAEGDRVRVFGCIEAIGASRSDADGDSSHEATFSTGLVDLDVHWALLAPGRLPDVLTHEVLARRVRASIGWRPDDTDCAFVALVHPAFAKHVCTRHMGLNRVTDTLRLLQSLAIDTTELKRRLSQNGVTAAAQASLTWISMLTDNQTLTRFNETMNVPSLALRQRYLAAWLRNDWPDYWVERNRFVLHLGFTSWLHDSVAGAVRAAWRAGRDGVARRFSAMQT
jgi:hypothetical protein